MVKLHPFKLADDLAEDRPLHELSSHAAEDQPESRTSLRPPFLSEKFKKRRASLMPATKILVSIRATTGRHVGSPQRSGGALDKEGREDALRAQTSLGFSDSRERGRMPPRLAYIQSATYGRQSSTLERGGGEGAAAAADSTHSDASPDRARKRSVVDGLPMERPLQYLELEQLLHSVSDKMHTSNNQTWIASSQAFARGSWPRPASRVAARDKDPNPSRPSSKDGSRPGTSEGKSDGLRGVKGKGAAAVVNAKDGKPGLQGHEANARGEDVVGGTFSGNPLKGFLPSEASMQLLPESRGEKVNRSQSAMTWAKTLTDSDDQVLRPIRQQPKSVDELDMQAKQAEYASRPPPPLNKDERFHIGHVKGGDGDDVQIEPPHGTLVSSDADIVSLQRAMNLESSHVRDQLRRFAHGHVNKLVPKSTLLPPAKKYVWKEEIKKIRIEHAAAVLVQKYWRRCNRRKKFLKYSVNCLRRKIMCMKKIMQVWLRLSHQREHEHPPGSNVRGLMSYWLIRFNVSVKNAKIARDKAADCYDLWSSVWLKRVMRNWRKYLDISSFDRLHRMNTWLQPWKDFYSDFCFVREAERKTTQRFVHAALRCLLFYARCSAKLKLRAKKLFRLEEDSVYELLMPIQRFPGYFNLFHPIAIMEKFRRKDWYERRVYRQCYKRIIPWVFSRWHGVVEQGRKWRVVVGAYDRLVLNRAFSAFCFLLVLDDLGQRVHVEVDREMDQERLLKEEATKKLGQEEDQLKELENSMDDLSGLVDYEHREMIRSMIRDEKHKTLFRIRCDALEKERNTVGVIVAAVTKDLEASAREQMEADETFIKKRKECEEFIADLRHEEIRKWDQNIQNVYDLFTRATDIMGNVLEQAAQLHAARIFRICWRTLCKPAFRVRMRRVYNRAHVQRLLKICFQFLKMERSIYKYYPLRVKFYAVMKWFKVVEFKYQHTSYGLKTLVRRRQDQYMALSNALRAFTEAQTFARAPNNQEFHTKVFVCLRWKERVQSVIARREVVKLFRRRRAIHVASRCFDFLKHGVPWFVRMEGPDAAPPRFLEIQAGCDLLVWKKDYFCGVSYAKVLRRAEWHWRRASLAAVRKGPSLVNGLQQRQMQIEQRLKHESRLLMRYFEDVDVADDVSSQGLSAYEAYPSWCWGTVLNLRHNETISLLDNCNRLARNAKLEFDSISVGLNLSNWLFEIRCHKLPEIDAAKLPSSKRYWKHIDKLFAIARQSIAAKGNVR